jgi:Zn-dependent M28 family amino/carboxypeptidase
MMSARLYKRYVNLSNIIIRLSDGTHQGKADALLVNSHLDSTLPSPGAADDALAVGVMIECVRVLVNTPGWEPKHAVVFCESSLLTLVVNTILGEICADAVAVFNNAEESLQDGSHLFSTQHPIASTCVLPL